VTDREKWILFDRPKPTAGCSASGEEKKKFTVCCYGQQHVLNNSHQEVSKTEIQTKNYKSYRPEAKKV
jgi:hypothetical protein